MGINRLDHAAIRVPDLGAALAWYEGVLGMRVLERAADRAELSCRGEAGDLTLVRDGTGLRDFAFGVDDADDLDRAAATLSAEGVATEGTEGLRPGEGAGLAFATPSGHRMRLVVGAGGRRAGITRFDSDGSHVPCGIDHINVIGEVDPEAMRRFLGLLGFRFSFSLAVGGEVMAAWMRASDLDHDIAYSRAFRPTDRLHHVAFSVEDGNHYFRLSDRLMEHRLRWEFGPGRHNVGLGSATGFGTNTYAYARDPAGNRIEFCSGMDRMAPDAPPRVVDIGMEQMADVMNGWGHEHPESMMLGS